MKSLAYLLILIKRVARKILNLKFVIMLENQNIFAKYYIPNWSEEVFVIKRLKSWIYPISDLNAKKIVETKKELQKTNQKVLKQ